MNKEYIDTRGHWHHIAQFNGKLNRLKSLILLAIKTEPNNKNLSARQLAALTGLGIDSTKSSLCRWQHWHNRYVIRRGRARQYRYSVGAYGLEFLSILHMVAPDKEIEFLSIVGLNRERIEREKIVMRNDGKISLSGEITSDDRALKAKEFLKKYLPNWRDTREDGRKADLKGGE
jgi:hypothetical protein